MRSLSKEPRQQVLLSECHSCSWGHADLCNGPRDAATYLMQGENFISCLDTSRRETMFWDTFKRTVPPSSRSPSDLNDIPYFIPTITESGTKISDDFANNTFGISLGKIIGKRGNLSYSNVDQIKSKFGLPSDSDLVLIGTSPDPQLENLWKIHERFGVFERIANMGFIWVTSLTYSVWIDDFPRPDQLRNQYRNLWTYDLFTYYGVQCIPFFFPVEDIDFQNLAIWLAKRPSIKTIGIYARYHHQEVEFQRLLVYMERIQNLTDNDVNFLVCGIGKGENIARLKAHFNCFFENSKMFEKTIHGEICDSSLIYSPSNLSIDKLFHVNFEHSMDFCKPTENRPIIYLKKPKVRPQKPVAQLPCLEQVRS